MKNKKDSLLSFAQACQKVGIAAVTGRNWLRLGKWKEDVTDPETKEIFFYESAVNELKTKLSAPHTQALHQRRNKRYKKERSFYKGYVSEQCQGQKSVLSILERMESMQLEPNRELILLLVGECLVQRALAREKKPAVPPVMARLDWKQELPEAFVQELESLLAGVSDPERILKDCSFLFEEVYPWEPYEDVAGLLYLSLLGQDVKKRRGAYYTPGPVVKQACGLIPSSVLESGKILDPCCGTGNFMMVLERLGAFENAYGTDVDPVSVSICRLNMASLRPKADTSFLRTHYRVQDFLNLPSVPAWDAVTGNPPWGIVYSPKEIEALSKRYVCSPRANPESSDLFVQQALALLKEGGQFSMVLPQSLLSVSRYGPLRKLLLNAGALETIVCLESAFDRVVCPSLILALKKSSQPSCFHLDVQTNTRRFQIQTRRPMNEQPFAFWLDDEEWNLLQHMEKDTLRLKGRARFALGIVSGNNRQLVSDHPQKGFRPVLKGSDVHPYQCARPESYIFFDPQSFQQMAPLECYQAAGKLVYRFISRRLVAAREPYGYLSLNSCNILLLEDKSLELDYVLAILNSRMAQFYFEKAFHSLKVLRSHLEALPIPDASPDRQKEIARCVQAIAGERDKSLQNKLYNELDAQIASLFSLEPEQYERILEEIPRTPFE